MQSATTSVGHLPDAMLIDGKHVTALKDDESISTLSTRDCSRDGAPSAAFNDGWTTFKEWNNNKRPSYQISDDLFNKMTCNICTEEVFKRFTSKGEVSGCKHDFCYRCIWKWENMTIIKGNCFQCPICKTVCTLIDQIKEIKSINIPKQIYLTSKVEYLDSNEDDITGDYWHCNICGRYYAKLDSTQHEFVCATGTTHCCKQVACYVCLDKALKDDNNRCPLLCKVVCDHVKFCEHHLDIVIQKDQDYAINYHSHITIPTVLEQIEVDNQIQHDEALPDLGSSNSKDDDLVKIIWRQMSTRHGVYQPRSYETQPYF
jgi:hypothetical protein